MQIEKQKVNRKYTVGFIFNPGLDHVILLRKTHQKWQRNRLNGIGGAVEEKDKTTGYASIDFITYRNCMIREAAEETGMGMHNWVPVCLLHSYDAEIQFYATVIDYERYLEILAKKANDVGELFVDVSLKDLNSWDEYEMIPNLRWLIPLSKSQFIDHHTASYYSGMEVFEDSSRPE